MGLTICYISLSEVYFLKNDDANSEFYALKTLNESKSIGYPENQSKACLQLYKIYKKANKDKKALEMYETYIKLRDGFVSTNFKKLAIQQKFKHEYELKVTTDSIKTIEEKKILNAEVSYEKSKKYFYYAAILIVLVFSIFIYNRFLLAKKQNFIIEEQKRLVDEKQKEIFDSINYAKRIQEAIFPDKELKFKLFSDAFVLFKPKDIVSGDFYWFEEKNGKRLIAAADCTGHGVPGAFMSMIGINFMNQIVNEENITEPGKILSELRHKIIKSLKQNSAADSTRDGMDISLLCFNDTDNTLEFAGANNPLWVLRNGQFSEYKGDKRPIGYHLGKGLPFTNTKIDLQKGDTVYIFTDGFADQFGGPKGKKYKYKNLQEFLISIQNKTMLEQEVLLLNEFGKWKGPLEQIDDVLIIGIRV